MKLSLRVLPVLVLALSLAACGGSGGGGGSSAPGPQITVLAVDITAGTVTVTSPASNLVVTGTATQLHAAGDATVDLSVLSNFPRLLFNLKAVVTSIDDGTAAGDGLFDGNPYKYFGPNALAPGAMESGSFNITGLTGTTFTMTIEWLDHPMVFVPDDNNGGPPTAMDSSGTGQNTPLVTLPFAFQTISRGNAGNQGGCVSPDGRFLYLSPRNQSGIITVDLTTMTPVMGTDLSGGTIAFDGTGSVGFLDDVQMSPDGAFLYALLTVGCHAYSSEGGDINGSGAFASRQAATTDVHVVKIDRATMAEVNRATLATGLAQIGGDSQVGKGLSLSRTGSRLAACIRNGGLCFVVDANTMAILDADPITGGVQGFDTTSIGDQPRRTFFRDDNNLLVAFSGSANTMGGTHDGTMLTIDVSTLTLGTLAPSADYAGRTYHYIGAMRRHPDGRMFLFHPFDGSYPCVAVYDFLTASWTTAFPNPDSFDTDGACLSPDGTRIYIYAQNGLSGGGGVDSLVILDAATLMVEPFEATGADETPTGGNGYGHTCIVTPF
ncbi:MAG: hypothetical protein P1V36_06095 [Planctomycetota bacterium]|nr:hypothetical protein [Planctomycetota bacterium]